MKKLLAIIAAVGLTATTSSVVVSCTTTVNRFSKLNFSDKKIYDTLILKMLDNEFISVSQAQKFLKISDSEIITDVLKILDRKIAEEEYKATSSTLASTFKVKEKDVKENITNKLLNDLATNQFFSEYTAAIIGNSKGLVNDYNYSNNHSLNPFDLFKDDAKISYSIYFENSEDSKTTTSGSLTRWQVRGEFGENNWNIPSFETLNNNKFYIVGSTDKKGHVPALTAKPSISKVLNKETSVSDINGNFLVKPSESQDWFTGKEIMKYRFQSYINAKIIPDIYTQLISLAYLDSNLYTTNLTNTNYTRSFARLNTTNKLVSSFQNSLTAAPTSVNSNIKLIWSFKADVSQDATEWVNSYKKALNDPNAAGNVILKDDSIKILRDNFNSTEAGDKLVNTTKLGMDPFSIGLKGYNGIVKNNDTGVEAISGSLSISTDAQTAAKSVNQPTLLTGPKGQGFAVGDKGESEIVLVLPLYLNDIYDATNVTILPINGKAEMSIPENTWLPLGDKYSQSIDDMKEYSNPNNIDVIKDKSGNLYIKVQDGQESGQITLGKNRKTTITVKSKDDTMLGIHETINKADSSFTSSFDEDAQAKVKDTDKILFSILLARNSDPKSISQLTTNWNNSDKTSSDIKNLSATNKQLLISEIEKGLVTGDTDYTTEAKEELYTKYIMDGDNVLFQGLYDEISKYIKEDEGNSSD
ncbi:hypothetical protein MENTO_v1c02540 [Mesoplasma entomophilum]|uniref:Lipoprotein n=1 Tax=Mesoplasma entomophilum TaxID=2149 RepID=A0A3S5XZ08_9MOLU|nr:lipoprotein [Mesoplasma entomophilum]ATQ35405.1 hypothetical protein CS528_01320 [Mesoplasma entomophilum]ATZ19362.1 hypothetical protein MENTO_v1c02540 [Mesoplasma entomophilum]